MGRNGRLAVVLLLFIGASILGYSTSALAQTEQLSLQQCIDMALEKNLGIISKEAAAERAGLDRLDAWGAALPRVEDRCALQVLEIIRSDVYSSAGHVL